MEDNLMDWTGELTAPTENPLRYIDAVFELRKRVRELESLLLTTRRTIVLAQSNLRDAYNEIEMQEPSL